MEKKIVIVNNTNADIRIIENAFVDFAKTGILSTIVADLFCVKRIETETEIRIIVNFLGD